MSHMLITDAVLIGINNCNTE